MSSAENAERRSWKARKSIRGLVLPLEQDDRGNVVRCSIITDDDEEFEVFDDEQGRELCEYVDDEVVAKGIVRFDSDGPDRIRVEWFRAVEWEDDLEDDHRDYDDF